MKLFAEIFAGLCFTSAIIGFLWSISIVRLKRKNPRCRMGLLSGVALAAVLMSSGCGHGQVTTPPVTQCPPLVAGGTAYTALNQPANTSTAASVTATSYADPSAVAGTWCYGVQSWAIVSPATTYQASMPSNVAGPFTISITQDVALAWAAPAGSTGYGYVILRAAAITVPAPLAPSSVTGNVQVGAVVRPALPSAQPIAAAPQQLAFAPAAVQIVGTVASRR